MNAMIMPGKLRKLQFYVNLINPFIDRKTRICNSYGTDVDGYYDFLEASQWLPEGQMKDFQNEKLRGLIKHAYENVPYYRELFLEKKMLPGDIKTADDLNKMPLLTKDIIRKNFPDGMMARNASNFKDGLRRTGASTGEPLIFYGDRKTHDVAWASFLRFYKWMGYDWGDREARLWGFPVIAAETPLHQKMADWLKTDFVPNRRFFDAFNMDEKKLHEYANKLIKFKPHILRGYVSALTCLADYFKRNNITNIKPKAVTTTAEMLHKRDRNLLEEQFMCGVFDQYACGECMGVAFECEKHNGMHITAEHCIVEVVDENGNKLEAGKRGMIVITDLDNHLMPFIRYVNGDAGSLKKEKCSCGRGLPLMDYVDGRISDVIKGTNGNVVHGEFFTHLIGEMGWFENYEIQNYQAVQTNKESIDWYLVCKKIPDERAVDALKNVCCKYLGNMQIEVHFTENIPTTPSGKRRFTRSEIAA